MSSWERHGTRDLSFSRWHRQALRQYAASEAEGAACGMIDVDAMEFCGRCKMNLFLVECAQDVRLVNKRTDQIQQLAKQANLPAYCVLYTRTDEDCPSDRRCRNSECQHGISGFRVRQVAPVVGDWSWRTPAEFAGFVLEFHRYHESVVCRSTWLDQGAA